MNWKDPRKELPIDGQKIWIMTVDSRGEDFSEGEVTIHLAQASVDRHGIPAAEMFNYKGFPHGLRFFYSYWFYTDRCKANYFNSDDHYHEDDQIIRAWADFEGLPRWHFIDREESRDIVRSKIEFLEDERLSKIEEHYPDDWISVKEYYPKQDGLYAVKTDTHIYLTRYELKQEKPWKHTNGQEVRYWFPVPEFRDYQ